MVEIDVIYQGELRCQSQHGPSGNHLITDAPLDNHGRGAAFSPTDLLATSLGSCMLTIMGIQAEKHGWDLTGATARVSKHMSTDLPRRVAKLEVQVRLPEGLDASAVGHLRKAAAQCPVRHSLHPDIEVIERFES